LKFNRQSAIENQQFRLLSTGNQCHNTPIGAFISLMQTGHILSIGGQRARPANAEAHDRAEMRAGQV
jgi:hypothetical protein